VFSRRIVSRICLVFRTFFGVSLSLRRRWLLFISSLTSWRLMEKALKGSEKPLRGTVVQLTESGVISLRRTRSLKRSLARGFLNNHLSKVDCSLPSLSTLLGKCSSRFFLDIFFFFLTGSVCASMTSVEE